MLAVSILAEDSFDQDEPTCFSSKEALQILQLGDDSSRDLIKEQYLKLATPLHPEHSKALSNNTNMEFKKLTHALYAALFNSECSICNNSNCKECWQVKDLLWGLNCLGQDLEEEEHEADCNGSLYIRTLEKYITNLTYRKKSKERTPSTVLSEKDEEMLNDFFKFLIENKEKENDCPKCKEVREAMLEEAEFAQHLAQVEQIASKSDDSRQQHKKKSRKTKTRGTQDALKGKSLSKSEALQLDSKRKHELEDIRKELMKKAKLAEEPKHHQTHIVVRKNIIDDESRQEIERQRQEKENRRLDMEKKMKQQAVQERYKFRKLKRNQKKQSLNSSSSSAYPSSISDASLNTSSECSSRDSSINEAKEERQIDANCKETIIQSKSLDTVSENPLFEDRKRGVTRPPDMHVEEAKKMKLSEGEPFSIDSGLDKDKAKLKNECGGEVRKNQRKNEKSKQRKKERRNSRTQKVSDSRQLEESSSGSFLQSKEIQMETDLSTDHKVESSSCQLVSMSSSVESSSHPMLLDPIYDHVTASDHRSRLTYADVAGASANQATSHPVGRSHAIEVSDPCGSNTSHELRLRPVAQPHSIPHPSLSIAPPPGFTRQQPLTTLNQKTRFPSILNSYISPHTFSQSCLQIFTLPDILSLPILGKQNSTEPMEGTQEKSGLDVQANENIAVPCTLYNSTNKFFSTHQAILDFQSPAVKCETEKTTSINLPMLEKLPKKDSVTTSTENLGEGAVKELEKKLSESLKLANSKEASRPNVNIELHLENESCILNQRHIPDHWDDNFPTKDQEATIERLIEESRRATFLDTRNDTGSKISERNSDFSNIKRNLKSIRHTIDQRISVRQRDKSETSTAKVKEPDTPKSQNSMLASFERLSIKDDVKGVNTQLNVKTICQKREVENDTKSALNETSSKWTLLAPHNARESGKIQTKNENGQKNETTVRKSHLLRMRSDIELATSRVGFSSKSFNTSMSSDTIFSHSMLSSCLPHDPSKSERSYESLLEKVLKRVKPREVQENTYAFSSKGISSDKSHEIPVSGERSSHDAKTDLETNGHKKNWSEGINDNFQMTSISKNFRLATENHQNSLQFVEQLSSPSSFCLLEKGEYRRSSRKLRDEQSLQSLSDSNKFLDRKMLHPIRRPNTLTQCMQASQVGGMRKKATPTNSWLDLFTFDKSESQTSYVPSISREKCVDSHSAVNDDVKNTSKSKTSLRRTANPSALFQHALCQIKEERGLSPTSKTAERREFRKYDSSSIPFPTKPSMKTADKLPKLNIDGLSSF